MNFMNNVNQRCFLLRYFCCVSLWRYKKIIVLGSCFIRREKPLKEKSYLYYILYIRVKWNSMFTMFTKFTKFTNTHAELLKIGCTFWGFWAILGKKCSFLKKVHIALVTCYYLAIYKRGFDSKSCCLTLTISGMGLTSCGMASTAWSNAGKLPRQEVHHGSVKSWWFLAYFKLMYYLCINFLKVVGRTKVLVQVALKR